MEDGDRARLVQQDIAARRDSTPDEVVDDLVDAIVDAESPFKSVGGPARVGDALRYSLRGLAHAWRVESAFRQELSLAVVLVPLAFFLRLAPLETLALVASVFGVLIVELINSSIEAAVDRVSLEHHPLAGRAKDLGSAAVFLALLLCVVTWCVIAGPTIVARLAAFA